MAAWKVAESENLLVVKWAALMADQKESMKAERMAAWLGEMRVEMTEMQWVDWMAVRMAAE